MNRQKVARGSRFALLALVPLCTILHLLNVLFSFDQGSNYFHADTLLPLVANLLTLLTAAVAIVSAIAESKQECSGTPFGKQLFVALPAAIGLAVTSVYLLVDFFLQSNWLAFATAVFLILTTVYVLRCETSKRQSSKTALLGFASPLACALLIGVLYFDTSLEMNAPMKVATQCALLPLMLYFTAELRYLLGRELPRLYLALALISLVASSLCILAVPAASIAGFLKNTNCLFAAITVAGLNVTVLLRLKRFLQPTLAPDENETKETDVQ